VAQAARADEPVADEPVARPSSLAEAPSFQAPAPLEVTVRAAPLRHVSAAPTLASSVLSGDQLSGPGLSAADVLARVPGVQVSRTGAQADVATASIRGADARQVPVYLAGVRLNDEVSGTADLSSVPLWMIDRVEIYRGNAPSAADRLGMGGAIFFWPKLPRAGGVGAGAELGSFGERDAHAWGALGSSRAAALVAVRRAGARNDYPFVNDQGQRFELDERRERRQNADFSETDAWVLGRYELGRGARLSSVLSLLDREQGVTGLSVLPARAARGRTRRLLFGSSVALPCGSLRGCQLELDTSAIAARSSVSDPLLELGPTLSRFVDNRGERASQRVHVGFELGPALALGVGVQAAFENLRVRRAAGLPRGGNRRSVLPALDAAWELAPEVSLHALGALECHATRGASVRFGAAVTDASGGCAAEPVGRVGVRYAPSASLELLSNLSRALRVPSLAELYGTSALVDGNPALRPERSVAFDVGARYRVRTEGAELFLDGFAFARRASELVRYRRTSLQAMSPFNVSRARLLGVELALSADLLSHVRLEASGTLLDPRETTQDPLLDPTANDILPNTARLTLSTLTELYVEPANARLQLTRASIGLRYQHKSSRFEDPAGQNVLPEQNLCDIELAGSFLEGRVTLRAALRNAFDAQTSDLIGLPVPGRSYHAALELSY
jgi:vitamin B12 transporter